MRKACAISSFFICFVHYYRFLEENKMKKHILRILMLAFALLTLTAVLAFSAAAADGDVTGGIVYKFNLTTAKAQGIWAWNYHTFDSTTKPSADLTQFYEVNAETGEKVDTGLRYDYDSVTGKLTIYADYSVYDAAAIKNAVWGWPNAYIKEWYPEGYFPRGSVKEIVIDVAGLTTLPEKVFNQFSGVTKITMPKTVTKIGNESLARLYSLTTLCIEGSGMNEDGYIDLRNITSQASNSFTDLNSSKELYVMISEGIANQTNTAFGNKNNSGTYHIYVPEGYEDCKWITDITNNREVKFTVDVQNYPEGAVKELGYQVRTKGYTGLRAKFSYSGQTTNGNYTLKEFGTIAGTEANVNLYGYALTKDQFGEYETADSSVKKVAINMSDIKNGVFYVSVVNYSSPEQMKTPVFMCAYEIWTDKTAGTEFVLYSTSSMTHCAPTSIYDATVGMFKAGLINSSVDEDGVLWEVLDNFRYNVQFTGEVSNVTYNYSKTAKNELLDNLNNAVTVNVFELSDGTYTAIVRGNGIFNGGCYTDSKWRKQNHLSAYFLGISIDTLVIDEGITTIGSSAVGGMRELTTLIYANSVIKLSGQTFHTCPLLKTLVPYNASLAKTNPHYVAELAGTVDISQISSFSTAYLFYSCGSIETLILPTSSGLKGEISERFTGSCVSLKKIYVAGAEVPEDGTADLRGTGLIFNCENEYTGSDKGVRTFQFSDKIVKVIDDFGTYERTGEKIDNSYTKSWVAVS